MTESNRPTSRPPMTKELEQRINETAARWYREHPEFGAEERAAEQRAAAKTAAAATAAATAASADTTRQPPGRILEGTRESCPAQEDDDEADLDTASDDDSCLEDDAGDSEDDAPEDDACDASDDEADAEEDGEEKAPEPAQAGAFDYRGITVRKGKQSAAMEAELAAWEKDVRRDAQANGGVVPPEVSGRSLSSPHKDAKTVASSASDTEALLNGLIAECSFLMHEVAYNSARQTSDPDHRIRFLASAESMAVTAAKVADAVGRLRSVGAPPAPVETRRHELVYTHITPSPRGRSRKSSPQ